VLPPDVGLRGTARLRAGTQWCRKIEEFSLRMDTRFVTGVCRAHYAVILVQAGSPGRVGGG
jgi:hypothetical protein